MRKSLHSAGELPPDAQVDGLPDEADGQQGEAHAPEALASRQQPPACQTRHFQHPRGMVDIWAGRDCTECHGVMEEAAATTAVGLAE